MRRCSRCSSEVKAFDRFCSTCGCALANDDQLKGHRLVTVVFSDLCGYSTLSEKLDPEDLKCIMDMVLSESTRIIKSFGGLVEKYVGDAVIAMFGLHKIREDDPVRAIKAAVYIHAAAEKMNRKTGLISQRLRMHTGINTGEVLYDVSSMPYHHGPLGKPINIASRLSDMAGPGEILIGESIMAHAFRYFHIEWVGRKILKGFRIPISIHKVLSERKIPLPLHRENGMVSRMVGREADLSLLREKVSGLTGNRSGILYISGDAGVGKSRLIQEFKESLPDGVLFYIAHCMEHAKDTPYYPVSEILRQILRVNQSVPDSRPLQHRMEKIGIEQKYRDALCRLCGCGPVHETCSCDDLKVMTCDAVTALISSAANGKPIIFCLEDIHWADQSTMDLLEYLARSWEPKSPGLLIITDRQRRNEGLPGMYVRLDELTKVHTAEMLKNMMDSREIHHDLVDFLHEATGGNPFYIEEAVNYLLDKGFDGREPKDRIWKDLPATLHALIGSRLDGLPLPSRRVIQEAALIGRTFSSGLLEDISSVPGASSFVGDLEARGFVHHVKGDTYSFRHDLTREVSSRALLRQDRMRIHRRIAVQLGKNHVPERDTLDRIAFHFEEAGEEKMAVHYRMKAAELYRQTGAWFEAAAHYQAAQVILSRIRDYRSRKKLIKVWEGIWMCSRVFNPDLAIDALESLVSEYRETRMKSDEAYACIRLINLYSQKGSFKKALRLFDYALALSEGDQMLVAAARTAVAYTYTFLGKPVLALEMLDKARPALSSSDPFLLAVNALTTLAASVWKGDVRTARRWYDRVKQLSGRHMDLDYMADIWLAHIHSLEGEFEEAKKVYREVVEFEKKLGRLAGGYSYLRIQGSIYFRTHYFGEIRGANLDLESFHVLAAGMEGFNALDDLYRAWISLEEGNAVLAGELIESCLPELKKGVANRVPYALNALAEAYLMAGRREVARDVVLECIRWNEENGNQDQLVWALRLWSRVSADEGEFDEARKALKRAFLLAKNLGLKPQEAWLLGEWGEVLVRVGEFRKACSCFRKACSRWKEMGNRYQAEKIEGMLGNLSP